MCRGNIGILSPDVNRDAFTVFPFVKGHSSFCIQYILLNIFESCKQRELGLAALPLPHRVGSSIVSIKESLLFMVFRLDGNSGIGAQVRCNLCYLICVSHKSDFFFSRKLPIFLHTCATSS